MDMVTLLSCTFLAVSPILCVLSNNWLVVWVCLEMSTMTFTFLVMMKSKSKAEPEAAMKYFIIQSSASGLLLALFLMKFFFMMSTKEKTILSMILVLKMGAIPFHLWFLSVSKSLKWNLLTVLMTWQKLAPIYLMAFSSKMVILVSAMLSMAAGTIMQYKNNKIRLLMAYSSISNSCWIMMGMVMNTTITLIFICVYFLSVAMINLIFKSKSLEKSSMMKKSMGMHVMFFLILLLSGMPPTVAFVPKWMLIKEFATQNMTIFSTLFMTLTAINFYIYLRLFLKLMMNMESKNYHKMKISKEQMLFSMITLSCGMMVMSV